ncbi:hypothetical protein [Streptomyces sp. NPDC086766]|uniref:hypothetical protein n=1 Tax=Streptomyces sp. NPDC086766 TaxID=3365754 RepID=UPI00382CC001
MRRHTVRTAITLCAATALAAGLGTASAAPGAPPGGAQQVRRPERPVLVDCLWHPKTRPDAFILACGDGNSRLYSLRWSQWGSRAATARGLNAVNDCKPYCAAGRFHSYRVLVRLDHPQPWKKHPQRQHYTRMVLVFPDGRPDGYDQVVSYPLWN